MRTTTALPEISLTEYPSTTQPFPPKSLTLKRRTFTFKASEHSMKKFCIPFISQIPITMKSKIILLLVPALFLSLSMNGQQTEKTLVKLFDLKGNNVVLVDVDADVTVNEWTQDQMRVIMRVSLENGSDMMLKSLVKVGRYNLESVETENGLKIFVPDLQKQVKLRSGDELVERINFEIYAPADVLVQSKEIVAIAGEAN